MKNLLKKLKKYRGYNLLCSLFKNTKEKYRHGTCYKLFYGRIYCIQKTNWLGDFYNIFETVDEEVYETKVRDMQTKGIVFVTHNHNSKP